MNKHKRYRPSALIALIGYYLTFVVKSAARIWKRRVSTYVTLPSIRPPFRMKENNGENMDTLRLLNPYIGGVLLRRTPGLGALGLALMLSATVSAAGTSFFFTTGNPDGRMATTSHPEGRGKIETESADDFILTSETVLQQASFTGLLFQAGPGEIREVVVEIYRVFPKDSNATRTIRVPTRMNSPGDDAFAVRSSSVSGELRFTTTVIDHNFQAANSVIKGIHPAPNPPPGGEGPVGGQEIRIDVVFETPIDLPADHYFFVPQVRLQGRGGDFLWLSTPRTAPVFTGDLQMWIRDGNLDPDWLRVGTDIVGGAPAPTFNGSFSVSGFIP
jgi:hypothetical protein